MKLETAAEKLQEINGKRKAIEAKAGIIQFSATIRRENLSLKVYIPIKDRELAEYKEGDRVKVFMQKMVEQ